MAAMFRDSYTTPPPPKSTPVSEAYNNYGTAVRQQSADYRDIMNKYSDIYNSLPGYGQNAAKTFNYEYTVPTYQTTADYDRAIGTARQRATSGVYSDQDQANIRERGISPIRSVYANAQRNLNRSRSLAGGYSPNYAAVSAKMAREMSSQLSDATTRVNAQLAQDIAAQKERNQSEYIQNAAAEQNARNQFALNSAEMGNKYGMAKTNQEIQDFYLPIQYKIAATKGMNETYGTTPAFAKMMGDNAARDAQIQSNTNQANATNNLNMMRIFGGQ